jgi:hypothetical protein
MPTKTKNSSALLAGFFLMACECVVAQGLSLNPVAPLSLDTIRIKSAAIADLWVPSATVVKMTNQKILVTFENYCGVRPGVLPAFLHLAQFEAPIGQLPAGAYEVEAVRKNCQVPSTFESLGKASFTVAAPSSALAVPVPVPLYNFSDIWWSASEPGWGVSIHVKSGKLFAAWFVYGSSGDPVWYTLQGGVWHATSSHVGKIFKASGPYFGNAFNANAVTATEAGSGSLIFTDYDRAMLEFTVNGVTVKKEITRTPF